MSRLFTVLAAVTAASATLTTTLRYPDVWYTSALDDSDAPLSASVIDVSGDKTTLAMAYLYHLPLGFASETVTYVVHGTTSVDIEAFTTSVDNDSPITFSVGCTMPPKNAPPKCTYSENGEYLLSMYCSEAWATAPAVSTTVITWTADEFNEASTETVVHTAGSDLTDAARNRCAELEGKKVMPEDMAVETQDFEEGQLRAYQVVITAGEEKLAPTAGSSPGKTGPEPTGTAGDGPSAPENTGAAANAKMVPALAGLGAAVAAFFV